ncbi:putative N-hydroxyarylamine O-acetyltransferase [Legionella wadsworthii]|uniref:Putative N-hydroxyarylamine O-acetyltransferase n=1 Tax=Legionella wadsworthii TaxID=28088 RepID=A0A378LU84_9GAMM|nr:arylamine N-acetyltransferase [Legionella wadsworthii]STY31081.1 putative N-hydroxyarylamine O-acetyltransferase [Legionella wadsworthii]
MKINLKTYLQKLKVTAPSLNEASVEEKLDFLKLIYAAHVQTIPYSNSELREISKQHLIQRSPLSFFSYPKLLSSETGGYCFQTAALLFDALTQLGYSVSLCTARVLLGAMPNAPEILRLPPTHLVLIVEITDRKILLDPGLGSSAPRFPIIVTGENEAIIQNDEAFKFYLSEDVYVLEKQTRQGWFRLMQTDLVPISLEKAAMNLLKLERFPEKLPIRDTKTVFGIITQHGRKALIWDAQSNQLKYSANQGEKHTQKVVTFEEGHQILAQEFGIEHISAECLEVYCTELYPMPIKPWTIEFPLDAMEMKKLQENLNYHM